MQQDQTTPRTIWTETLLDLLVTAVQRRQDTEALRILRELKSRGYRRAAVTSFCARHLDAAQLRELERVIESMRRPS